LKENDRLPNQLEELRAERRRLQAELEREVRRETGVHGGGGASADGEIDRASWPLSSTSGGWLSLAAGRQVMEAILDKAQEDLRRAVDETTSLRARLHAADAQLQEQALQLEVMLRKESGEAAFCETHPWLAARVERHMRFGKVATVSEGRTAQRWMQPGQRSRMPA
jgi:chromosome segregation ATPase